MDLSFLAPVNPEMTLILFIAVIYLFTFGVGNLLEKIRIPWIFGALIFGVGISVFPVADFPYYSTFKFLGELGMYFMLFLIGFEIDLQKLFEKGSHMVRSTLFIILLEGLVGSLLIRFLFGYSWFISALVAVSFATVGEAMLVPILDEFGLIKTDLGQMIVGVGVIDDAVEILTVVIVSIMLGAAAGAQHISIGLSIGMLLLMFALTYGLSNFKKEGKILNVLPVEDTFLFVIFILFLFISIGLFAEAAALGAVLAGIAVSNFLPSERTESIETDIKSLAYGLFGPLFFVWVGAETNLSYLIAHPLLIILIILVTNSAKLLGSWIVGRKRLGTKKSIVMGISLSVRFSTSIIIIKLLHEAGIIQNGIYSVLIATTILFKFIVPFVLSKLIVAWGLDQSQKIKI